MPLVEIARFQDVYEADLAAAFLASHDVEVSVTERYQTTVDPLMQRALGIRLMARASEAERARDLLARARAGEFAEPDGDDLPDRAGDVQVLGALMALAAFATGGFWGNSLPRRFRGVSWMGILAASALFVFGMAIVWAVKELLLNPP